MSNDFVIDPYEMEGLVAPSRPREPPHSGNRTGITAYVMRPHNLFVAIFVAVVLIATFCMDGVEIKITVNPGSAVAKNESASAGTAVEAVQQEEIEINKGKSHKISSTSEQKPISYAEEIRQGIFNDAEEMGQGIFNDENIDKLEYPRPGPAPEPKLLNVAQKPETSARIPHPVAPVSNPSSKEVTKPTSDADRKPGEAAKSTPSKDRTPTTQKSGFKKHPSYYSDTYLKRGKPVESSESDQLAKKWGSWTLLDANASTRPSLDELYASYPNRDVPYDMFPADAWQKDKSYLADFITEGRALVERAMEAILTEYGHGKDDEPEKSFEERSKMFSVDMLDLAEKRPPKQVTGNAGWTTERSMDGLARRILHAIMTEDNFNFVMGGHSSAAGHGNHFQQSYTLQVQKVLEPVFARLGVNFLSRNVAMGGLGTIQSSLGFSSIYGPDIDILMWDSGMTEKSPAHIDLFGRQGLISGSKVPVLWGLENPTLYHEQFDADVGVIASGPRAGSDGIPEQDSIEITEQLPWAAQYVNCAPSMRKECRKNEYMGVCWIDRPDFTPSKTQKAEPGGRASWHPGNRKHQLTGRLLAFTILRGLDRALSLWSDNENHALPDSAWHLTSYYENIRSKAIAFKESPCYSLEIPDRVCDVPMKAYTEFAPRYDPENTSIRSAVKEGFRVPEMIPNVYDPPDVRNPNLDVPDGVFDYLAVLENGVDFAPNVGRRVRAERESQPRTIKNAVLETRNLPGSSNIFPGKGWKLRMVAAADNCDGTYDSFCGRGPDADCLLYGHSDQRVNFRFDGLSGWMVVTLRGMQHGVVIVRLEAGTIPGVVTPTEGWVCENNDCGGTATSSGPSRLRGLSATTMTTANSTAEVAVKASSASTTSAVETTAASAGAAATTTTTGREPRRSLAFERTEFCDEFRFEFAVNGVVTSWDADEFWAHMSELSRMVRAWTLVDDTGITNGEVEDVEFAIRVTGCGRDNNFGLSHIYYA